jgi:hypothetical protein
MSALLRLADISWRERQVRFVPTCDIATAYDIHCRPLRFADRLGNGRRTEAPITPAGQLFADPLLFWQGLTGGGELHR